MIGLCSKRQSPKCVKISKDFTMEEIHNYFGPIQNKNGYNKMFNDNPKLIMKMEGL
jgi:hypothetical protein